MESGGLRCSRASGKEGYDAGKQAQLAQDKADCEARVREMLDWMREQAVGSEARIVISRARAKYLGKQEGQDANT
jgi:hypothetical protein